EWGPERRCDWCISRLLQHDETVWPPDFDRWPESEQQRFGAYRASVGLSRHPSMDQ
ncbi:MAG: hypothetical protein IRY99_23415, partial [Isosphaeraceae bacterium]|nr:hypothetical protein [Isosphaeraceae bacterium]